MLPWVKILIPSLKLKPPAWDGDEIKADLLFVYLVFLLKNTKKFTDGYFEQQLNLALGHVQLPHNYRLKIPQIKIELGQVLL